MKKNRVLSISFLFLVQFLIAQKIEIKPYLQDAESNSIKIMWQTDFGEESIVYWGLSKTKLSNKAIGKASDINFTDKRIHEVAITGLTRFTTYFYKVQTGKAVSKIYQFKTPPFAGHSKKINLVAMSDMQYDSQYPTKFTEIVEEGVLTYFNENYKGDISDNLAMVVIPGDLVVTGSVFSQWQEHFFKQSEKLFSNVPVYPVLGNHERNSDFYFKYFSLPKNGSPEYAEHWWFKDYANTRIIGLDSNNGYRDIKEQLKWLKELLDKTAKNDDIDFVFAQLHHPHKSELWIPGEEDFSGKVVKLLEAFSKASNKPSLHFFGHTHGYSRGQSKEHKHLWVNVASAGGAIDNWGEFEGRDYDEFTVTQDEYGFVLATIDTDKENPSFTLKRISRGNNIKSRNNELRDSITVFKKTIQPNAPVLVDFKNANNPIHKMLMKANTFKSDKKDAFHAATNWQVATNKDFSKIIYNSWKQHENWYYKENRQKDDDLTDEFIDRKLSNETTYYVRVRYRDQFLNWSDWSAVKSFKTDK
ncbi:metallophosphoesterase [Polaribacter reichenbachii]|uniref:Metallophosphoesterase n=1 Tax=Polaribacter reichenbachii TaxID=996801 RepID=A0A1B8U061_9FLAO|nr:metallophosphoesterase family protein [Polaribacter reichenbachii]APZ47100.1 metallophosphoesterase [Polaribacter reichenbachii]AUC17741.1 metallophosphoesterase [Polaribacter reichenbachii]OBY65236.1 metallophosphoesterase [Polaribacter reichenbachii]